MPPIRCLYTTCSSWSINRRRSTICRYIYVVVYCTVPSPLPAWFYTVTIIRSAIPRIGCEMPGADRVPHPPISTRTRTCSIRRTTNTSTYLPTVPCASTSSVTILITSGSGYIIIAKSPKECFSTTSSQWRGSSSRGSSGSGWRCCSRCTSSSCSRRNTIKFNNLIRPSPISIWRGWTHTIPETSHTGKFTTEPVNITDCSESVAQAGRQIALPSAWPGRKCFG